MKGKKRRGRFSWVPNFYLILVLLILYLPTFVVVAYSFNQQKDGLKWTGFTTEWYPKLFQTRQIMEAMRNSLIVAGASCLIAAVVGTLGGVAMARRKSRLSGAVESISAIPIMLPEIVLGLAFLVTFSLFGIERGLLSTVLAHATFCIPYVLILVRSRLAGLDPAYEEAARDLGASPMKALLTVTVPLIAPAILSGVFLAFAMSLDDFVISYFTSDTDVNLAMLIYSSARKGVEPTMYALSALMFICILVLLLIVNRRSGLELF